MTFFVVRLSYDYQTEVMRLSYYLHMIIVYDNRGAYTIIVRLSYNHRICSVRLSYTNSTCEAAPALQDKRQKKKNIILLLATRARSPKLKMSPGSELFETASRGWFRFSSSCTPTHETNTRVSAQSAPHMNYITLGGRLIARAAPAQKSCERLVAREGNDDHAGFRSRQGRCTIIVRLSYSKQAK